MVRFRPILGRFWRRKRGKSNVQKSTEKTPEVEATSRRSSGNANSVPPWRLGFFSALGGRSPPRKLTWGGLGGLCPPQETYFLWSNTFFYRRAKAENVDFWSYRPQEGCIWSKIWRRSCWWRHKLPSSSKICRKSRKTTNKIAKNFFIRNFFAIFFRFFVIFGRFGRS